VRQGDTVTLIISDGIEQVEVPEIPGNRLWSEYRKTLESLGFTIGYKGKSDENLSNNPFATVKATNPEPGSTIDKGSVVEVDLQFFAD
jgi:beta-lactam-binding protein with PASTA domain